MSNTARKARKREGYNFTHNADGSRRPVRTRAKKLLNEMYWFDRRHKAGTPFHERQANQPRPIFGKGPANPATRHGITSRTAHALISRGYTADGLHQIGYGA
jgi:hypothetical protein